MLFKYKLTANRHANKQLVSPYTKVLPLFLIKYANSDKYFNSTIKMYTPLHTWLICHWKSPELNVIIQRFQVLSTIDSIYPWIWESHLRSWHPLSPFCLWGKHLTPGIQDLALNKVAKWQLINIFVLKLIHTLLNIFKYTTVQKCGLIIFLFVLFFIFKEINNFIKNTRNWSNLTFYISTKYKEAQLLSTLIKIIISSWAVY